MILWYIITAEGLVTDSDPEPKEIGYSINDGGLHLVGEPYLRMHRSLRTKRENKKQALRNKKWTD